MDIFPRADSGKCSYLGFHYMSLNGSQFLRLELRGTEDADEVMEDSDRQSRSQNLEQQNGADLGLSEDASALQLLSGLLRLDKVNSCQTSEVGAVHLNFDQWTQLTPEDGHLNVDVQKTVLIEELVGGHVFEHPHLPAPMEKTRFTS